MRMMIMNTWNYFKEWLDGYRFTDNRGNQDNFTGLSPLHYSGFALLAFVVVSWVIS